MIWLDGLNLVQHIIVCFTQKKKKKIPLFDSDRPIYLVILGLDGPLLSSGWDWADLGFQLGPCLLT